MQSGPAAPVDASAGPPTDAPVPSGSSAVRKNVTAMFADLVGSTAFSEQLDPEAARTALAPYFDILRSSVEDRAGTVLKFTGDGVLAVFGIPEVAEDDALRAVATGVDLQRRFGAFTDQIRDRHGVELGLRVGINSGELVIADGDADLVGDVLNTAARLEAECTPGRVLVGEDTWRLTRSVFGYEVLGEVRVRGKAEPVASFLVDEGVVAAEEATPFVGREIELQQLLDAFNGARDSPVARLVTVIGPPGVGKTRLAHELRAATQARSHDLRLERRGSTTFTPIADLLREVGDGSAEGVSRLFDEHPERARLVPILQSFLGHGEPRSTEESFWATRRLLEHLAELHGPTIVVVDDIQWAEPRFWDLLDHLVEWAQAPVLIVALARPELRELRPELAQPGRRVAGAIALEGLDATSTRELAARLLDTDDLPDELVERIPDTTEGNPLFVRELVQMLVDDGTLARAGDRWRLTIDVEAVEVPPTVLSLLATRVERLPDDERQLVELASVIGTEFDRGALSAIIPTDKAAGLGAVIDRLRRKDLIEPSGAWAGDHPVYRFHHVLVRDAAYRRLLKVRRAELHEAVGRHLEQLEDGGDELDVTVAHHFEQVVLFRTELGDVDETTTQLAGVAVERLRSAAESALASEDLPAAGGYATRALDLVDRGDPERDELLVLACEALLSSGDIAGATPLVRELHERSSDDRLAAWADCFRAQRWSFTDADRLTEASDLTDDAARRLADLDDQAGVAKARLVRAGCLVRLGRVGDCEQELDLALGAARGAGDRRRTVAVLGAAPLAALWGPSPVARAGGRCLDVLRLLRITTASPAVEATSIRCQGMLEALRGRFDSARDKLEQSRATARELGLRHALFETELFAGFVELWAEDPAAAETHLRAAYEGLGRLGLGADAGQAGALLARSIHRQGRLDEAEPLAREAVDSAGQNLQTAMEARAILAEIRSLQGSHDEARQLVDEAIAIAERTDDVLDHALVLLAGSRIAEAASDTARAEQFWSAAQRLLGDKGVTVDRAANVDPSIGQTPEANEEEKGAPGLAGHDTDEFNAANAPLDELVRDEATGEPHVVSNAATRIHFDEPVGGQTSVLSNRASELTVAGIGAVEQGNLDGARSMMADNFVAELRLRIAAEQQVDREQFLEILVAMVDQGFRSEIEVLAVRGDDLALMRTRQSAELGVTYRVLLAEARDGVVVRMVSYDPDLLLEGQVELDRLYFDEVGIPDSHVYRRLGAAAYSVDPAVVSAWLHPDFQYVENRPLTFEGGDRAAMTGIMETMAPGLTYDSYVVTIPRMHRLTETCSVFERIDATNDGAAESRSIVVTANDGDLITCYETFAPRQLDEALARSDELAPAQPPTPSNAASRVALAIVGAAGDGDGERVRPFLADDFVHESREQLRVAMDQAEHDADQYVARIDEMATGRDGELEIELDVRAVRGEHFALVTASFLYGDNQILQHFVVEEDGGSAVRIVQFGDDQLHDALDELERRFRDRDGAPPVPSVDVPPLTNTAWELSMRFRHYYELGDADGLRSLFAPDYIVRDRKPHLPREDWEVDSAGDLYIAMAGDATTERAHPIAVRGDDLCLVHVTLAEDGWQIDRYCLVRSEGDLLRSADWYDIDQLAEALLDLDAQWLERGGPAVPIELADRGLRSFLVPGFDLDELPFAENFMTIDHRPIGMGQRDLAAFLESSDLLTPSIAFQPQWFGWNDRVALYEYKVLRHDDEFVWHVLHVNVFTEEGIHGIHVFGLDQFAEAQALFAELSRDRPLPSTPPGTNVAWEVHLRVRDHVVAGDWDGTRHLVHPGYESTQRTPLAAINPTLTGEAAIAHDESRLTGGTKLSEPQLLAVRGDDLCVFRHHLTEDAWTRSRLVVVRTERGLLRSSDYFDDGQLSEALDLLDALWGSPAGDHVMLSRRVMEASARLDREGMRRLLSDDFELIDHRQLGFGRMGPDEFVASANRLDDARGSAVEVVIPAVIAEGEDLVLHTVSAGADDATWRFLVLSAIRHDKLHHRELFDHDQLDAASARFADLAASTVAPARSPDDDEPIPNHAATLAAANRPVTLSDEAGSVQRPDDVDSVLLPNAAWRTRLAIDTAVRRGDRDGMADLVSPDFRLTAHFEAPIVEVDRDTYVDASFEAGEIAGEHTIRPLEWRGDHLCFYRSIFTSAEDWTSERLVVFRTDDNHRLVEAHRFHVDQRLDAQDLLDQMSAQETGVSHVARLRRLLTEAWMGDEAKLQELLADDFVRVDHRTIGMGTVGRSEFVDAMVATVATWGGSLFIPAVLATYDDRLSLASVHAELSDDSVIELLVISLWRNDQLQRQETFDITDLAGARARFAELCKELASDSDVDDSLDAV